MASASLRRMGVRVGNDNASRSSGAPRPPPALVSEGGKTISTVQHRIADGSAVTGHRREGVQTPLR